MQRSQNLCLLATPLTVSHPAEILFPFLTIRQGKDFLNLRSGRVVLSEVAHVHLHITFSLPEYLRIKCAHILSCHSKLMFSHTLVFFHSVLFMGYMSLCTIYICPPHPKLSYLLLFYLLNSCLASSNVTFLKELFLLPPNGKSVFCVLPQSLVGITHIF